MPTASTFEKQATFQVENIGGIDETSVQISPGVTVLTGRNATNRTSFLQAAMAAMGSTDVTLKGDADEGHVELELGSETYTRTLARTGNSITTSGESYLTDPEIADLFAFLLESNEARRAVARGDDLRDLIMRPVDTDAIQSEIRALEAERSQIDDELEELEERKRELPDLEKRRTQLEDQIEEKQASLAAKEDEIREHDAEVDETRAEKQDLEDRLEELRDKRQALERVRSDIELQQESIESLEAEKRELEAEREEVSETPMADHQELETEIETLRENKERLESEISDLQDVIQFNEEMLTGDHELMHTTLEQSDGEGGGAVTDKLVADDDISCWTCGSEVDRGRIEDTLAHLKEINRDKLDDVRSIEGDLSDRKSRRNDLQEEQRRREQIGRDLDRATDELEERRASLEDLRDEREGLTAEIEELEVAVESLESEHFSEILDLHKQANQMEFELGRLESDLDDVSDRIATIEDRLAEEQQLKDQREELTAELTELRNRIDNLEQQAVEQFNDHMDSLLEILEYENLERVWLERIEKEVREGRRKTTQTVFELHVIRSTASGANYEDTVDHLSESEREVTGLVFALGGYLVHNLHEEVPFMLIDSVEAIDADRIAALVRYFADFAPYLIVALLPEDATALDDSYTYVSDI